VSIGGAAARPRAMLDSEDIHDDVSLIAHLAFAKANHAEQRDNAGRPVTLFARETLELDLSDPAQRMFGGYELLELIGEGGMGVVYRARQIGLDREVAVKLLAAGPWASAEFVERFQREAQNAARMQHPNIVAIYEVGDAEDLQFFSMRLVRGGSLSAVLKHERKLPPLRAAQLLRTIAEAVDYAHRLGVLHLDLKPGNVLLDEDGVRTSPTSASPAASTRASPPTTPRCRARRATWRRSRPRRACRTSLRQPTSGDSARCCTSSSPACRHSSHRRRMGH